MQWLYRNSCQSATANRLLCPDMSSTNMYVCANMYARTNLGKSGSSHLDPPLIGGVNLEIMAVRAVQAQKA